MRKQDRKHIVSKRFKAEKVKVDKLRAYDSVEALDLVKSTSSTKFDSTVDVAVRLGVDPRQGDQMVRGTTDLPHGTGKSQKVAVFARGANADAATAAVAALLAASAVLDNHADIQSDQGTYIAMCGTVLAHDHDDFMAAGQADKHLFHAGIDRASRSSASRTASQNRRIRAASLMPFLGASGLSTPELTSTAKGRTRSTPSITLAGFNPPDKTTGQGTPAGTRDQSKTFPDPP